MKYLNELCTNCDVIPTNSQDLLKGAGTQQSFPTKSSQWHSKWQWTLEFINPQLHLILPKGHSQYGLDDLKPTMWCTWLSDISLGEPSPVLSWWGYTSNLWRGCIFYPHSTDHSCRNVYQHLVILAIAV